MLQRLGIRGKLLAVILVPVLVLLATVAYISASSISDYRASANAELLVETLGTASATEADIQTERTAALNFVDIVQDTSAKLGGAREEVATRYEALAAAVAASDDPRAEEVLAQADAALGGTGDAMLASPRSLTITPPSEAGEWLGFPSADEIAGMDSAYADAVSALDALAESTPDELNLTIPTAALAFAVESEAGYAHTLLEDPQEEMAILADTFGEVDQGLDNIRAAADQVEVTEANAPALASVDTGGELRDALPQIRAGVMSAQASTTTILNFYTEVLDTFVDATDAIAIAVPDRQVVASLQAYGSLDRLIEQLRYEGDSFNLLIRSGVFVTAEIAQTRTVVERTRIALEDAQSAGLGMTPQLEVPDIGASNTTTGTSFTSIQNGVLTGLDSALVASRSANWPDKVQQEIDQYAPLRDQAWQATLDRTQSNSSSALTASILTIALGVGAVIASVVIAFVIARRIVVPLRRLTTTATAVREELPRLVERVAQPGEDVDVSEVQIPVESRDEVGRLAEAFNGVNAATLEIAREQAALRGSISEMFVNVARRDQVLLNRQLSSIDEMERSEDDPSRLTKLFALDHLATRMRRNSESLLVLAGIETGRRLRRPMPLSDVVRTASSEIELYERIDLELVVDPAMLGHQALTAAHLFAELLENATVFSDPGSRVVVRTGRTPDGFTVEVVDSGIGMTVPELAEANGRVQSSAASEILGAQRLGLFVVGRIARRLGAEVAIASVEGEGTVATVLLPSSLFEAVPDDAPETTPAAAPAAAQAAPAVEAYAPAALMEGAGLAGRGDDPAGPATVEADDDDSIPMPVSLDALIAADAAAAPEATPVSPTALTEGTSAAGLPSRRRRGSADAATSDERNVIGLPVRATADQLSALDAEADAFTPSVSPTEVAPQTPEDRASMFRGFRPRRETEGDVAPAADVEPAGADAPTPPSMAEALAVPSLEPDGAEDWEPQDEADTVASEEAASPARTAAALGGAFAALDAIHRASGRTDEPEAEAEAEAEPESEVEPEAALDVAPDDFPEPSVEAQPDPVAQTESPATGALPTFAMPKLSTGEVPTSPLARSPYGAAFSAPPAPPAASATDAEATAGDVVSDASAEAAPAEHAEAEPAEHAAVEPAAAEPADTPAAEPAPEEEFSFDSIPQLEEDEPELAFEDESAPAVEMVEEEPALEAEPAPEPAAPWLDAAAFATAAAAYAPPSEHQAAPVDQPEPVAEQEHAFEPEAEDAGVDAVALDDSIYAYQPPAPEPGQPSMDDIIAQASGEEAGRVGFFGRLFGRGRHGDAAPSAPVVEKRAPFAPGPDPLEVDEPVAAPTPPAAAASFTPAFEPASDPIPAAWTAPEPARVEEPVAPEPERASFSPEELAQPAGWETAGESALAAADHEVAATSYQPVFDTENPSERSFADEEADLTSAVFSELSSLSESRPKVEKTKAGLQKRKRADDTPTEVTPIAEEVELAHKERDADAVRQRFSSFYSGTQRAREDAAELELRSTPQPANE